MQVVLKRRAREQQLALSFDEPEPIVQGGLLVLDTVALVQHEVAPVDPVAEDGLHVL